MLSMLLDLNGIAVEECFWVMSILSKNFLTTRLSKSRQYFIKTNVNFKGNLK